MFIYIHIRIHIYMYMIYTYDIYIADVMDTDERDRESQEFDYSDGIMDDNDGNEIDNGGKDDYDEEKMLDYNEGKKEKKKEKSSLKKKGLGGPGFPHTPYSQENIYAHADWLILEKIQADRYIVDQLKGLLKQRNLKVSGQFSYFQAYLYK
jgi:hypothetical protein